MDAPEEMPIHLHRSITFAEYESASGLNRINGWQRAKWEELRAEIESVLAQGDELWEWEYRSDFGLTGVTGLAVVRGGTVVRKWQLWKA